MKNEIIELSETLRPQPGAQEQFMNTPVDKYLCVSEVVCVKTIPVTFLNIESKLKRLILGKKRRVRGYPASSYGGRCEFLDQVRKFYTDQDVKIIQDALQKALERRKENQTDDSHNR